MSCVAVLEMNKRCLNVGAEGYYKRERWSFWKSVDFRLLIFHFGFFKYSIWSMLTNSAHSLEPSKRCQSTFRLTWELEQLRLHLLRICLVVSSHVILISTLASGLMVTLNSSADPAPVRSSAPSRGDHHADDHKEGGSNSSGDRYRAPHQRSEFTRDSSRGDREPSGDRYRPPIHREGHHEGTLFTQTDIIRTSLMSSTRVSPSRTLAWSTRPQLSFESCIESPGLVILISLTLTQSNW